MDSEENKMKISDTPRTDDAEYLSYDSEPPQPLEMVDVGFARQLEIELNTAIANEAFAENKAYMLEKELKQAQDRIKRLEAVTNDPHALWANWLRGSVGLPVGIGDVREYQDRIKRLEDIIEKASKHFRSAGPNAFTAREMADVLKEAKL
jgi:hypothetical protein